MEEEYDNPGINSLPNELLLMILDHLSVKDSVYLGSTCKKNNELVKDSQGLWRNKLKSTVSERVYDSIQYTKTDINWYNEIQTYFNLKKEVYARISDMAAFYYKCNDDITLDDVRRFFDVSFTNGLAYFCTIDILQDLHKKAEKHVDARNAQKPFTLTEIYYSRTVLQHMIHGYLAIKWVQAYVKNNLPPELVLNFFLQWVNPLNIHTDESVILEINELARLVQIRLQNVYPSDTPIKERIESKNISEGHIIAAISHVMYKDKRIASVAVASLDTLNIRKVLKSNIGHDVVCAAIYHAIARRLGVQCELISFPNHLFLEWHSQEHGIQQTYKIELETGKLTPKRTCPFSRNTNHNRLAYSPGAFLEYVTTIFLTPWGNYKTWFMQNGLYLLDFLSITHYTEATRYTKYLQYLWERVHLPVLNAPSRITQLTEDHIKIIVLLSYLTIAPPPARMESCVNKRPSELKYGVGMVCYHRGYDYVCVVRGWERSCRAHIAAKPEIQDLPHGPNQPFYIVVAVDQSERYVAQDQLVNVKLPTRLYHMEDMLAKEFTHFNGFSYVPNIHKQSEYPDDSAVCETYRCVAKNFEIRAPR